MNKELISVIVPIYNVENYLQKCLDSILNQTYTELEIILIDDGSTDKSGKICDEYKKIDKRIKVNHRKNAGLSSARNYGIDVSTGKYLMFIDSDDYLEPTMIYELYENLVEQKSDISVCDFFNIKNGKVITNKYSKTKFTSEGKEKFDNIENEYKYVTLYAWNKLYKKEMFDDIKYPEGKIYEDSYVLCDLMEKARKVSYVLKPLYNHVYRDNSLVNNFSINHFDKIESINKKIYFFVNKGYYDLILLAKKRKMNTLIMFLAKMKRYKINNKEISKKYYQELVDTNREVKWREANYLIRLYKAFRKIFIIMLAFLIRIRDGFNILNI